MKSAIFKMASVAGNPEQLQEILAAADIIFAKDEDGNPIDGCGWNIHDGADTDTTFVGVKTVDSVMDILCQDPRLELVKQLEGWPEEIVEEDIIDI